MKNVDHQDNEVESLQTLMNGHHRFMFTQALGDNPTHKARFQSSILLSG